MADLKPDRVRAAELAQTGAGRGRARGEKIEREHWSQRFPIKVAGWAARRAAWGAAAAAAKEEAEFAAACGIAVGAAAGRTVAEQGRQGRQLAAEATEAAATPTGDNQQRDAEAACARDWSRHWQAGAFAAWGWGG